MRFFQAMLSAMIRGRMISPMTTVHPQQRYDHRLRELVQRTGDLTVATDLGVPRSTARGWLRTAPTVVVSLDVAALTEPQLRQEVLTLRRHVHKLAGLLRLALVVLRVSGFTFSGERLPDGADKLRILRAIDQARTACRCGLFCDSFVCRPVGSTRGDDDNPGVHSTITRPVPARRRID
jgi:hypothetical protein